LNKNVEYFTMFSRRARVRNLLSNARKLIETICETRPFAISWSACYVRT
jgi:hypothetical protein